MGTYRPFNPEELKRIGEGEDFKYIDPEFRIGRCESLENIDPEVRNIVRALNKIPFIATGKNGNGTSCSGHLLEEIFWATNGIHKKDNIMTKPDDGFIFPQGGHVCFYINMMYKEAHDFINRLEKGVAKYPFVDLSEIVTGYSILPFSRCYEVAFEFSDLYPKVTIKDSDSPQEIDKKKNQIKLVDGIKRKQEFNQLLQECLEIAREYIPMELNQEFD